MIDIQHSNERNFCGAITPKEKDKIMKAILDMAAHERKTFCFTPNDVPNLKINGKQFEMVIMDFFEKVSMLFCFIEATSLFIASREHDTTIFPFCPKSAISMPAGRFWNVVFCPLMQTTTSTTISIWGNCPIGDAIGYFGLGAETLTTGPYSINGLASL